MVGVNSGHRTNDSQYRSRGIWVDPRYRGLGVSTQLFQALEHQAVMEGCEMIWSIPRVTALPAYTSFGFVAQGDSFVTETSPENVYVRKDI